MRVYTGCPRPGLRSAPRTRLVSGENSRQPEAQAALRGLCWLPGVSWPQLGMWWETWGQGLLTTCLWPRAAAGHGARGTVHPARWRTQTLSGGAGQPLPQSLRAASGGHPPRDRSWGICSVCLQGTGLLLPGHVRCGGDTLACPPSASRGR